MRRLVAVLTLVTMAALAGCLGSTSDVADTASQDEVQETAFLANADLPTQDKWSHPLENGTYGITEPKQIFVTSPAPYEDEISIGIVKPKGLAPNETVPVVADVGPYYGELEGPVTNPDDARLDNFLIENLVPHGYAVAMVSVPGTGDSGGCEDYFGPREQAAVDAAVKALGEKEWSSGKVGLIGKSYDGSTPWEAASTPAANEYLETIVPMAGIPSFHELHFMNGTAESRAGWLNMAYWTFGVARGGAFGPLYYGPTEGLEQPDPKWAGRACPAVAEHLANGATGTATGGQDPTGYWAERSFNPEVLEIYDGSVFIVHGLQDWNVHPDVVTSIWSDLDVKKKLWFGQWSHIYPDRPEGVKDCERCPYPESVRWDFAEVLLHWFDHELKGKDVPTGPRVWSEDNRGGWHPSTHWPPQKSDEMHTLYLGDGTLSKSKTDAGSARLYAAANTGQPGASATLTWTSEAFQERTRITGEPKFHFTVTPTTPDGNLRAVLWDVGPDGDRKRVGHAYMNLRYAAGGDEPQEVTPGEKLRVRMEMFPLDAMIPQGHKLKVTLTQDSPLPRPSGPITVHWGGDTGSGLIYRDIHEYETGLPWRDDTGTVAASGGS